MKKKVTSGIVCVFLYFCVTGAVFAQEPSPTLTPSPIPTPLASSTVSPSVTPAPDRSKVENLQNEIDDIQSKITTLQGQQKTLASQIAVMDSQIKLTELRIATTKEQISELAKDIQTSTKKIEQLETALKGLTKVLLNRIVATYQVGVVQPIELFFSSRDVATFLSKTNYLKLVQEHDKKLIFETQQAKSDYANQKAIFETKKQKVEALKAQLEVYTKQLESEKQDKQNLLAVTKNSEAEYQKRLAAALRELQQIQKAAKVLIATAPRKVSRGEQIGLMGNTGYSFGAHLHFGIYNVSSLDQYDYYSAHENPANSLESKDTQWDTGCSGDPTGTNKIGSGSFSWPMSPSGLRITQNYGHTCYSNVYYRGNPHPAFDMYNNSDITVRAVEEGQAYFCRNCTSDGANGVFIFHPNGKMSLYWHLQ